MSSKPLNNMVEEVSDEETLLKFVEALIDDRMRSVTQEKDNPSSPFGPDAGGWENTSIESFLEAAASWAKSTHFGLDQGLSASNPWKRFAVFLYCGKIYE